MQLKATRRFLLSCRIKRAYAFYCGIRNFFCFCPCFWKHETITEELLQDELYYAERVGCAVYLRLSTYFSLGKKILLT